MIAFVNGEVVGRREDYVVVQTSGGVGYHLAVSAETLSHVPAVGQQVSLHCHLVARDDSMALYGFSSEEERDLFLMLLGVQGVGPKVALALLSGGPPRELASALASGDVARLQAVPGIGKRTAERILVELDSLSDLDRRIFDVRYRGVRLSGGRRPARRRPRHRSKPSLPHPHATADRCQGDTS